MGVRSHFHGSLSRFLALCYTLLLVYGTLFPLHGWVSPATAPLHIMLRNGLAHTSWSDLVTNLLVYMPLGFLLMRGLPAFTRCGRCKWLSILLAGTLLSFALEYLQAYLPGRTPSARDLLLNAAGTGAGAWLALVLKPGGRLERRLRQLRTAYILPGVEANLGLTVLGLWALAQLAPLVPSLDLGSLWHGIKPLFKTLQDPARFSWLQWAAYVADIAALGIIYISLQKHRYLAVSRFLLFAGVVLLMKVPVVGRQLSSESFLGLAAAAALLPLLARGKPAQQSRIAIFLILAGMLLETVQPGAGASTSAGFNWVPFKGHLSNNLTGILDILSGGWPIVGLFYLFMHAHSPSRPTLATGTLLVFLGALGLEWVQLAIPGRSADITDALVAALAWALPWLYLKKHAPEKSRYAVTPGESDFTPGKPRPKKWWLSSATGLAAVLAIAAGIHALPGNHIPGEKDGGSPGTLDLNTLPPNRWVRIHQPAHANWRRQNHAGIAYDSRRHSLLIFGSDTHRSNWDNSVHEFGLQTLTWKTHYPEAPPETYRTDSRGNPVAGSGRLLPWAMHTFDTIVYDPRQDALVVAARPLHNPMTKKVKGIRQHPTWIYDLATHEWRILENGGRPAPSFFAGATAYDSHRDVIVAYKYGIWELGPDREKWKKATGETHHSLHFNMEYDSKHRRLVVFGDGRKYSEVWVYTPGPSAGERGSWEKKVPGGDRCPPDEHFPVAFDGEQGVFLLLPFDQKAGVSRTFIYDLETNTYTRLPGADMKLRKMNYMMTWDPLHKVFLLVTGYWKEPATVWALKLDLDALRGGATP